MKKLLLLVCLVVGGLQAQDTAPKPDDQPTLNERFTLMSQQRDALLAEVNKLKAEKNADDALIKVQQTASETGTKYNCNGWKPDFTCNKATAKSDPQETK